MYALQLLVDRGADPTIVNATGLSVFHLAVIKGNIGGIRLLLANGANVEEPDGAQQTALWLCATKGEAFVPETMEVLLDVSSVLVPLGGALFSVNSSLQ
jgi:ankyrin repeat protein